MALGNPGVDTAVQDLASLQSRGHSLTLHKLSIETEKVAEIAKDDMAAIARSGFGVADQGVAGEGAERCYLRLRRSGPGPGHSAGFAAMAEGLSHSAYVAYS